MKRIRIGNNIAITWLLYENNGEVHNLEGLNLELYMTCGGSRFPVTDFTVTENAIAWTFPAALQTKTGYYKLVLLERDEARGIHSFDVRDAFCLEPEDALENIGTISDEDCTVVVRSVLTYAHITNLASIDTVEAADGQSVTVVVRLTNGKSFVLPFSPGGGGGSGSSYILPVATSSKLGGIKVGFSKIGNKYPVLLDTLNNAYVEVPNSGGGEGGGGSEGGGGGSSSSKRIVTLSDGYYPQYNASTGLYSFDVNGFHEVPSVGDRVWYLGRPGEVSMWDIERVEPDNISGGYTIIGSIAVDNQDIFDVTPIDTLTSNAVDKPLSANQGRVLKGLIDDITGGGGGGVTPGNPGRSITGVQNWFKLCADESVQATPMNIADPSTTQGGSWSLNPSNPTASYPYLRCFMQVNYDSPLATGYSYSRSAAFTARYFNSDSTAEYHQLEEAISALRRELLADLNGYESDLNQLNAALEALRAAIQGSITDQLNDLRNRLSQITGTDVELIMNDGLWAVLTSYTDDTIGQKSFSDIVADAKNAKLQLQTGSTFFDRTVGGEITLNGILGQIGAKVTRQDVNAMIASAQFSVDPSSLNSVISKAQACWKKNGLLYPYDLYLVDYMDDNQSATLADYELYMTTAPGSGGPSGDGTDAYPAGPFELVVIVNQFSAIKQSVDEISASVDKAKYMWKNGNTYFSYDAFETEFANRSAIYSNYTYDQYVTNVLGHTKVEVGSALSNITATSDEIKAQLGDMGYFWRKPDGSGFAYERYAVPAGETRDAYVTRMRAAGWELVSFASRMSVLDVFPDSITSLVKNSTLCWINSSETGAAYCRDYDYWMADYNLTQRAITYEEYVTVNHPGYVLTVVTDAFSRIKQTADSITTAVEAIGDHEERISAIEQSADAIAISVSKTGKCWKDNVTGTLRDYEYFRADYDLYVDSFINPQPGTVLSYEDWVANSRNYALVDLVSELGGIKVKSDKIWAGVAENGEVAASIEILAHSNVDGETGSKIILDATNVQINGGLSAGVVKTGAIDAGAVTTDKLAANAVTSDKIDTVSLTTAIANVLNNLTVGTYSKVVLENGFIRIYDDHDPQRMVIEIGQGTANSTPVLKFYGIRADGTWGLLYDLGPNGIQWATDGSTYKDGRFGEEITLGRLCSIGSSVEGVHTNSAAASVVNHFFEFYPAGKIPSGGTSPSHYYNFNMLTGEWVTTPQAGASALWFYGMLVRTDKAYPFRPEGANVQLEVWPRIESNLNPSGGTPQISDGWYLDNTGGFLSNYHGSLEDEDAADDDEQGNE